MAQSGQISRKDLKVDIPSESEMISRGVETHEAVAAAAAAALSGQIGATAASGLTRQTSVTKTNCLCSPTTHVGSFRCRLHRGPSLQRTKSVDSHFTSTSTISLTDSSTSSNSKQPNSATASFE